MKIKEYIEFLKSPYANFKTKSNPLKCLLLFVSEIIILFFVALINRFIIEKYSLLKIIISCIVFLAYFILWCKYYRNLKKKMKDSNDDLYYQILNKYLVKMIFRILIAIHLLMIAWIVFPVGDWRTGVLNIILNITGILAFKDIVDWLFGTNIKIVVFILAMILFLGFILISKSTLALTIITFGGYYLINWFASEDSMYYLSSQYGVRINSNIIKKHKLRWAIRKAEILFIFISASITFGLKTTIPINWKKSIVDKIVGVLNNMRDPVYNDFLDREMIISLLVILTTIVIYVAIQIIVVKINRKESIVERNQTIKINSKKPRINKR